MSYHIEYKNDILTGATLIIRIPGDELDKKALYTIQADKPPFILPFRYVCIDGEVELIYQIGLYCKLQYLTGSRQPDEYAELWSSVLSPLSDCGDWFMRPYSFLLDAEHLYYDKEKRSINYIYIPSKTDISCHSQLRELAADISKLISVEDAHLENKVLRAIMKRFDPNDLLQILKLTVGGGIKNADKEVGVSKCEEFGAQKLEGTANSGLILAQAAAPIAAQSAQVSAQAKETAIKPHESRSYDMGDVVIDISEKESQPKKRKAKAKEKKAKANKKASKGSSRFGGLFSKKKVVEPPEGMHPDAVGAMHIEEPLLLTESGAGTPGNNEFRSSEIVSFDAAPTIEAIPENSYATENVAVSASCTRLYSIGRPHFPIAIDVCIEEGQVFTIGRYDASVGRPQSNFEFDRDTKAVSRRHAAIERDKRGYSIIDLASSAGTFINDEKILSNTPCKLASGDRISFGNSGADYVWEA
ncbi:MAG: FHA domain-containing protein [Oscillospiraceae bacterium]|nr:FHA domain-containing protein [Oscillospiraceae bacterium]